ncbi:MAG: hypothetical protein ACE5D6_09845, partial [Candidatus Zixiibacteriota bacterium]
DNYICRVDYKKSLRLEKPIIPYEKLFQIVVETFRINLSRSKWCKNIFERMNDETDYQNVLKKHELLSAVVAVNAQFIEIDNNQPTGLLLPHSEMIRNTIEKIRNETVRWVTLEIMPRFVKLKRITSEESDRIIQACENYILDYSNGCKTDLLPVYFHEVIPGITSLQYQKKYKHIFDTVIGKTLEDFKNRLRNDPTIRGFGDYLIDE